MTEGINDTQKQIKIRKKGITEKGRDRKGRMRNTET
jgi:hypothetical protein